MAKLISTAITQNTGEPQKRLFTIEISDDELFACIVGLEIDKLNSGFAFPHYTLLNKLNEIWEQNK